MWTESNVNPSVSGYWIDDWMNDEKYTYKPNFEQKIREIRRKKQFSSSSGNTNSLHYYLVFYIWISHSNILNWKLIRKAITFEYSFIDVMFIFVFRLDFVVCVSLFIQRSFVHTVVEVLPFASAVFKCIWNMKTKENRFSQLSPKCQRINNSKILEGGDDCLKYYLCAMCNLCSGLCSVENYIILSHCHHCVASPKDFCFSFLIRYKHAINVECECMSFIIWYLMWQFSS